MRISDGSSDVCSSDLLPSRPVSNSLAWAGCTRPCPCGVRSMAEVNDKAVVAGGPIAGSTANRSERLGDEHYLRIESVRKEFDGFFAVDDEFGRASCWARGVRTRRSRCAPSL